MNFGVNFINFIDFKCSFPLFSFKAVAEENERQEQRSFSQKKFAYFKILIAAPLHNETFLYLPL
jgi:hypothetical protein